jgi:hypothetical protein
VIVGPLAGPWMVAVNVIVEPSAAVAAVADTVTFGRYWKTNVDVEETVFDTEL